jgi:hypothetical protein
MLGDYELMAFSQSTQSERAKADVLQLWRGYLVA